MMTTIADVPDDVLQQGVLPHLTPHDLWTVVRVLSRRFAALLDGYHRTATICPHGGPTMLSPPDDAQINAKRSREEEDDTEAPQPPLPSSQRPCHCPPARALFADGRANPPAVLTVTLDCAAGVNTWLHQQCSCWSSAHMRAVPLEELRVVIVRDTDVWRYEPVYLLTCLLSVGQDHRRALSVVVRDDGALGAPRALHVLQAISRHHGRWRRRERLRRKQPREQQPVTRDLERLTLLLPTFTELRGILYEHLRPNLVGALRGLRSLTVDRATFEQVMVHARKPPILPHLERLVVRGPAAELLDWRAVLVRQLPAVTHLELDAPAADHIGEVARRSLLSPKPPPGWERRPPLDVILPRLACGEPRELTPDWLQCVMRVVGCATRVSVRFAPHRADDDRANGSNLHERRAATLREIFLPATGGRMRCARIHIPVHADLGPELPWVLWSTAGVADVRLLLDVSYARNTSFPVPSDRQLACLVDIRVMQACRVCPTLCCVAEARWQALIAKPGAVWFTVDGHNARWWPADTDDTGVVRPCARVMRVDLEAHDVLR